MLQALDVDNIDIQDWLDALPLDKLKVEMKLKTSNSNKPYTTHFLNSL